MIPVSGDFALTVKRTHEGAGVPVRDPVLIINRLSGLSGSVPCFKREYKRKEFRPLPPRNFF